MQFLGILVMVVGVIGFILLYIGAIDVATPIIWGGMAVVGMITTVMTGRPGN